MGWFILIILIASAAASLAPRAQPSSRALRVIIIIAAGIATGAACWVLAFPQRSVDFDTWLELARWKLDRTHELMKPHRPAQYYIEYFIVRWLGGAGLDERQGRALIVCISLASAVWVMGAFRRQLLGTASVWAPVAWAAGFLLTPGGQFLADSWNDHAPLVPFYLAGAAALIAFPRHPAAMALAAAGVFLVHSLLHSAEAWLWAGAIAAIVWTQPRRQWPVAAALVAFMALAGWWIISAFPGGATAGWQYVGMYLQDRFRSETLRVFAYGFAEGGAGIVRARFLFPMLLLVGAVWLALAVPRRRLAPRVLVVLCAGAVLFPLIYETSNPERYYTLAILWPIVALRSLRLAAILRPRRRGLVTAHSAVAGLFLLGAVVSARHMNSTLDEEHTYNEHGARLRATLSADVPLVTAPEAAFYLWAQWWHEGPVRVVETSQDAARVVAEYAGTRVYLTSGTWNALPADMQSRTRLVFEREGDPSARIYELPNGWQPE